MEINGPRLLSFFLVVQVRCSMYFISECSLTFEAFPIPDNSIKNRWHLIERNLAVGTMSDVYLKAKNKFSSKYPPRVSAAAVDGYHESDDSDSPCTKRFRPLIFEDLQNEPLESILFHYSRGVESDGLYIIIYILGLCN